MRVITVLLLSAFLLGCATTHAPEIVPLKTEAPQISKTLTQEAKTRTLKRKVAVARFTNETNYGKGLFVDQNLDQIGKQAVDIFSAKLAATNKFILLERTDIDKINKELKLGNIANLNIPADYLIIGSVTEFGRKEVGEVGFFSRSKKQVAYAKVSIRLVETSTGRIIYSAEGAGEAYSEAGSVFGVGTRAGYDSSLNDKAIAAAISQVINNIVEKLTDKPWRSYILSVQDGNYIIAGGASQGIRESDVFGVYKKGAKVKNPQTGMYIELPGELVGKIKIIQVVPGEPINEVSIAHVESGHIPDNLSELYIQECGGEE